MRLQESGAPLKGWAEPRRRLHNNPLAPIGRFVRQTLVIAEMEARKLRHDPSELITRGIQPALWLLIFGQVFSRARAIPTGGLDYLDFLTPGILAQSVMFIAIFYGIAIIWERDLGLVHKLLAGPIPRAALVLGKALSAGVRSVSQVVIIYLLAWLLGVHLNWRPLAIVGVMAVVVPGAAVFSTLSLIIACIVKTRERFMGIGQVVTMPLFFASNAIYPISLMPKWLQVAAHFNPLTYEVDALRGLMVAGGAGVYSLRLDLAVLLAATAVLVLIGSRVYPRIAI